LSPIALTCLAFESTNSGDQILAGSSHNCVM
jgi:hypothetical protein